MHDEPAHILNCILVAQPIAALDCIIGMPSPIILGHVAQCCIYASLSSHRVRPRRKELRETTKKDKKKNLYHWMPDLTLY